MEDKQRIVPSTNIHEWMKSKKYGYKLTIRPISTDDKPYHEIPLDVGDCTNKQKKVK